MRANSPKVIRAGLLALLAFALAGLPAAAGDSKSPESYPELKRGSDGFWHVDFGQLASFDLVPPQTFEPPYRSRSKAEAFFSPPPPIEVKESDNVLERVPPVIRSLDGQRVRIAGFMLPTHVDNGKVTDFLLLRSQLTCCYGIQPAPNEWVVVTVPGKGVPQKMDVPLTIYGVLHVGPMFEEHAFTGLYRLECEKVVAP